MRRVNIIGGMEYRILWRFLDRVLMEYCIHFLVSRPPFVNWHGLSKHVLLAHGIIYPHSARRGLYHGFLQNPHGVSNPFRQSRRIQSMGYRILDMGYCILTWSFSHGVSHLFREYHIRSVQNDCDTPCFPAWNRHDTPNLQKDFG